MPAWCPAWMMWCASAMLIFKLFPSGVKTTEDYLLLILSFSSSLCLNTDQPFQSSLSGFSLLPGHQQHPSESAPPRSSSAWAWFSVALSLYSVSEASLAAFHRHSIQIFPPVNSSFDRLKISHHGSSLFHAFPSPDYIMSALRARNKISWLYYHPGSLAMCGKHRGLWLITGSWGTGRQHGKKLLIPSLLSTPHCLPSLPVINDFSSRLPPSFP